MNAIKYEVYHTAFHGGKLISRHQSLAAAERVVRSHRSGTDCVCGCAGIIDVSGGEKPGTRRDQDSYSNPYAIGSI